MCSSDLGGFSAPSINYTGPGTYNLTDAQRNLAIALKNALDYILGIATLVVSIWFLIELGFLRGTQGPNQYGPDPLGSP